MIDGWSGDTRVMQKIILKIDRRWEELPPVRGLAHLPGG